MLGASFTVTVNAVDDDWNVVTRAADKVDLVSTDSSATLPPAGDLVSGTKTFSVKLNAVGAWVIAAFDATDGAKATGYGAPVTVAAQ